MSIWTRSICLIAAYFILNNANAGVNFLLVVTNNSADTVNINTNTHQDRCWYNSYADDSDSNNDYGYLKYWPHSKSIFVDQRRQILQPLNSRLFLPPMDMTHQINLASRQNWTTIGEASASLFGGCKDRDSIKVIELTIKGVKHRLVITDRASSSWLIQDETSGLTWEKSGLDYPFKLVNEAGALDAPLIVGLNLNIDEYDQVSFNYLPLLKSITYETVIYQFTYIQSYDNLINTTPYYPVHHYQY